jgi:hypothetical protein
MNDINKDQGIDEYLISTVISNQSLVKGQVHVKS